jgi:hypothetical protein
MNLEPPEYEAVVPCNWLQCLLITLLFHGQSKGNLAEYMHVSVLYVGLPAEIKYLTF